MLKGSVKKANGEEANGEFKNLKLNGYATYSWAKNSHSDYLEYRGDFRDDSMTGKGKLQYKSGKVY